MSYAQEYCDHVLGIASHLDWDLVEAMVRHLEANRKRKVFVIGLGGSAANSSHMAADLRRLCNIDAHCLDSMAELTARANDAGWRFIFDDFLKTMDRGDILFILSVGGGTKSVSTPISRAIAIAQARQAIIMGIVGPEGGETFKHGDYVVRVPAIENPTPHTEAFQAVIWHCLVSHPLLQQVPTKW